MGNPVELKISNEILKPIIDAKIQAILIEELGKTPTLIESVIKTMLDQKVDDKGMPSRYDSDVTLIQWLSKNAVQEAAQTAIKAWAEKNKEKISKELTNQMGRHLSPMVNAILRGFTESISSIWSFKVEIKTPDR